MSEAAAAAEIEQLHKDKAELAEQVEALKAAAAERAGEVRLYIYIYVYMCMYISINIYIHIYIYREREVRLLGSVLCMLLS